MFVTRPISQAKTHHREAKCPEILISFLKNLVYNFYVLENKYLSNFPTN